jgi:hypothetical protein
MNAETPTLQRIRLALSKIAGCRIFRNNVGMGREMKGPGIIRFGLFPGSADLIGFKTVKIEPHHVGKHFAVFVSCEVKNSQGGKTTLEQHNWKEQVLKHGGIAVIASSVEEAEKAINEDSRLIGALKPPTYKPE